MRYEGARTHFVGDGQPAARAVLSKHLGDELWKLLSSGVIQAADFTIIASIIDKQGYVARYHQPADPYDVALGFCMERLRRCLAERSHAEGMTYVQVERRGKTEDARLELAFRRILRRTECCRPNAQPGHPIYG
jgi:hypothetical protein